MKFGKIEDVEALKTTDLSLPNDDPKNTATLGGKAHEPVEILAGCPAWTCKEWVGKIYPEHAKPSDFLSYYAHNFQTIELNTTFYRTPDAATIARWDALTPAEFRFCPKISKQISHFRRLNDCQLLTEEFCMAFDALGEKLGHFFLQLPPNFSPNEFNKLQKFILGFPVGYQLAVEFRHPGWFADAKAYEAAMQLLASQDMPCVMTDVAGRRDVLHQRLTSKTLMVRFVGNELHPSDFARIDHWVSRLHHWAQMGLEKVYFFLHEPDDVLCPELGLYFAEQLNTRNVLQVLKPKFVGKHIQQSLF